MKNKGQLEEIWQRIMKRPQAVLGMILVFSLVLVAILADLLSPHPYMDQNIDEYTICSPFVFYEIDFDKHKDRELAPFVENKKLAQNLARKPYWMPMSTHVLKVAVHSSSLPGASILLEEIDKLPYKMRRNVKFPLGTDNLGRCLYSRLLHGTRISLKVGLFSQFIALFLGVFFGIISGFYGGKTDMLIMRITDIIMAFPFLLLVMAMVAVLEKPGIEQVFIAMGLVGWPPVARIVRAQVLGIKEKEFVEAATALGAKDSRIVTLHILPNIMAPVIVQGTIGMAFAIISEAGLSFLGLGAQPPTPSWGLMVSDGQSYLNNAWWLSIFPGIGVMMAVFGFNLFGDGLRDALDPRMKN